MSYRLGLRIAVCILAVGFSWQSEIPAQGQQGQGAARPKHVQPSPPLEQMLAKLAHKPAFISECRTPDGGRHILIMGIGGEGRLLEMVGGDVDNAAEVRVEGAGLTATFSFGGLWSEERLRKLLREFEGAPFRFVGAMSVGSLDRIGMNRRCRSITR